MRRQERQEIPVADDRPVFFLAKWVGREGSQETFRDQFLSFFLFSFLACTLFCVGDKLLEKISRTSLESLAVFSFVLFKLPSPYGWYGKPLYWNIFNLMFILKISLARSPDLKAFSMYPDLGPTYHFNADLDLILFDADLDTDIYFMRMLIRTRLFTLMWIRIRI